MKLTRAVSINAIYDSNIIRFSVNGTTYYLRVIVTDKAGKQTTYIV